MGKREDILAAARDLIVEGGLESLSFSKIFARAGVGSGTVYNYFASKEELVSTLYREAADLMDRELLAEYDQSAELPERFRTIVMGMARFAPDHAKELELISLCRHSSYVAESLRQRASLSTETAVSLVVEGQAAGAFLPMNPKLAISMIAGAITSVVQAQLEGKLPSNASTMAQVADACWRMIAADPSKRVLSDIQIGEP